MPKSNFDPTTFNNIVDGLKSLYKKKLKPLEEAYKFDAFHSALLTDSDISAKPFILLMGQYSTGKSTFVRYLLERDYPGMHIGPEPTTDKFVAVMTGASDKIIPGNAACVAANMPFSGLSKFGTAFLSKFQVSQVAIPFLENVTIIDTPGVLSGEKQRLGRSYDFINVCEWFAERADMILLLFDAHKLDISDEFRTVIQTMKPHSDKIRVVLNKADMISTQQLMRVYGALMWSLGKVVNSPEVVRVYVGSFWDNIKEKSENFPLIMAEHEDLLRDLRDLPRNAAVRKINEIVKRARMAKVHAYLIGHLRAQMPSMFGKVAKQNQLIENMDREFLKVQKQYNLPVGDFPDLEKFKELIRIHGLSDFKKLDPKLISAMDSVLERDLPRLMAMFPQGNPLLPQHERNPFGDDVSVDSSSNDPWDWTAVEVSRYAERFKSLEPVDGKVSGSSARPVLMESELPMQELGHIWSLSDLTKDGYLDQDEFSLAMHFVKLRKAGFDLPDKLPDSMKPPKGRVF